ncbi:HEAT repeat domain-containing protein [Pseudomonas sp. CGJS7]|uniref:HEAT repeat domain-containing protein n=1 Tax=Pseudomonas sp. CGJS7 TaxID=3109348 RepID=UPI003008E3B2
MNRLQLSLALLAAALAGGVIGHSITRASAAPAPHHSDAATVAGGPRKTFEPFAQTPAQAQHAAYGNPSRAGDNLDRMTQRARRDPAYLRELLRDYGFETELDKRGALLAVLQGVANQEVLRLGQQMAASSDPEQRRSGLDLLKSFSLDVPEVRDLLTKQIQGERDPAMLKQLVDMLSPAVIASEDAAPVLERLESLRRHADPAVRASSVLQSVQWNKSGNNEDILHQAILDSDLSVRQAAIAGITASGTRSDRLKDSLLAIAVDPRSDAETRNSAVFALQNFAMSRGEYALYRKAAEQVVDGDGHEREYPRN